MLTFVWFFLALSFLVLIHEFGHFIVAKSFKVYVHEFSIFMGPLLYQKQVGETKYSLRLLPIGGYCSMAGEQDMQAEGQEDEGLDIPPERTLVGINRFKQFLIAFAGPFMNIILALILMVIFFMGVGEQDLSRITVQENNLASQAGLKSGDHIDAMSSKIIDPITGNEIIIKEKTSLNDYQDVSNFLTSSINEIIEGKQTELKPGYVQTINFYVNGETSPRSVTRTFTSDENNEIVFPKIGISVAFKDVSFGRSIQLSVDYNLWAGTQIFRAVGQLFTKDGFNNVSGIVGMYKVADEVTTMGFYPIINFIAMISINLGLLNLLPFPGLDGGRIIIVLGESITRKKLPAKAEAFINNLGFIFLLGLIIAVTIKDIFFMSNIVTPLFKLLL